MSDFKDLDDLTEREFLGAPTTRERVKMRRAMVSSVSSVSAGRLRFPAFLPLVVVPSTQFRVFATAHLEKGLFKPEGLLFFGSGPTTRLNSAVVGNEEQLISSVGIPGELFESRCSFSELEELVKDAEAGKPVPVSLEALQQFKGALHRTDWPVVHPGVVVRLDVFTPLHAAVLWGTYLEPAR